MVFVFLSVIYQQYGPAVIKQKSVMKLARATAHGFILLKADCAAAAESVCWATQFSPHSHTPQWNTAIWWPVYTITSHVPFVSAETFSLGGTSPAWRDFVSSWLLQTFHKQQRMIGSSLAVHPYIVEASTFLSPEIQLPNQHTSYLIPHSVPLLVVFTLLTILCLKMVFAQTSHIISFLP